MSPGPAVGAAGRVIGAWFSRSAPVRLPALFCA